MKPRLSSQVVIGLMIVAVGVIFTLDNLGVIYAEDYLRYWPVALVLIGAVKVWQARLDGHGWFSGLLFLGVGSYMLINRIVYIRFDPRQIFPAFLVFLGGYLVWHGVFGRRRTPGRDGLTRFSALAVMGGGARRSNSQNFEGADLTAIMGGFDVDLRDASIAPNTEAVIDVFTFWGGIDLKVPEDWVVVNRIVPFMGGVDDKTRTPIATSAAQKRLVVRGIVIMGGINIRNRTRRDDIRDSARDGANLAQNIKEDIKRSVRESIRQSLGDEDRHR
ncbi:MAG TPA: DUF5668 domain-containing protein [Vicinamibacterales bacterium]